MSLIQINVTGDFDKLERKIERILNQNTKIMATLAQLNEKVDALQASLDSEQEQIQAAIAQLQTTIDELRQNQSDGGTAQERQALADKLDGIKTDLEGTISDNQNPETPTEPQ